jgi:hypothetical protein
MDRNMKLLNHDAEGASIHLDETELRMVMVLIQEGRLAFECDSPTGEALDALFRSAAMLVQEARITGDELTSTN